MVILLVLFTVKQTTGYRHSSLSIIGTLAEIRRRSGCPTEPLLLLEQELGGSMEGSAGPQGAPHSPLPYGLACLSSLSGGILAVWCTKAREQVTPTPGWPRASMSHVTSQIHPTFLVFFRWREVCLLLTSRCMLVGRCVCTFQQTDASCTDRKVSRFGLMVETNYLVALTTRCSVAGACSLAVSSFAEGEDARLQGKQSRAREDVDWAISPCLRRAWEGVGKRLVQFIMDWVILLSHTVLFQME